MSKRRTRFITWAKKDTNDTTKIFYTFKTKEDGTCKTIHFTSDDTVDYSMMERIRYAWIEKVEAIDNAWNVVLYED